MQFKGFRPTRMKNGSTCLPGLEASVIVGNATTIVFAGSALKNSTAGVVAMTANSESILGYCMGFIVKYGDLNLPLAKVATNTAYVDGTFTAVTTGDKYVAAADNVTDKKIAAMYMPASDIVCSALLDADVATTTGSGIVNYYLDIETTAGNAATILDESSASATAAQWLLVAGLSGSSAVDPTAPLTGDRRVMVIANEVEL